MIELLERFQGLIGALIGVTLGWFLSNYGKISFHFSNCKMFCTESDGAGSYSIKELEKGSNGEMEFELSIYNTSNSSRIIKGISVLLKPNIRKSYIKISDEDSAKMHQRLGVCDDLEFLNIPPNSVIKKHFKIILTKDEVSEILENDVQVNLVGQKLFGIKRKFKEHIFSISKGKVKC